MLRTIWMLMAALSLASVSTPPASAQAGELGRAALGGAVGLGGGAVVTLSTVVLRARLQEEYLFSMEDLIHWQSIPMIAAPGAGVFFGLAGDEPLRRSIIGSTGGMVVGAAVGAGVGWLVSNQPEGPWAGAVIGAGVGLTVGGLLGGITAWKETQEAEESAGPALEVRIPLSALLR